MLSQFNNEVLSYGPTAILPQNLSSLWLKRLQKISEDFLDSNFDPDECKDSQEIGDPILTACVYEILTYQDGDLLNIAPDDFAEKITIYALSIIMEAVQREDHIGLQQPNLDNILSMDRIIAFKKKNPNFVRFLKQICIVGASEKGWIHRIKEKLISS